MAVVVTAENGLLPKGERTRAALVAAAIPRFAADGFQHTSLTDIARDVGITPAAIYRYFPDKEALFAAAVDADGIGLIELVRATMMEGSPDPRTGLIERIIDGLTTAVDGHPLVVRVLSGIETIPANVAGMPNLEIAHNNLAQLITFSQRIGAIRSDVDAEQMSLAIGTIVVYHLAHIFTLRRAGGEVDEERTLALAALIEAALTPAPALSKSR